MNIFDFKMMMGGQPGGESERKEKIIVETGICKILVPNFMHL